MHHTALWRMVRALGSLSNNLPALSVRRTVLWLYESAHYGSRYALSFTLYHAPASLKNVATLERRQQETTVHQVKFIADLTSWTRFLL